MRQSIITILVCILMTGMLTACGSSGGSTPRTEADVVTQTVELTKLINLEYKTGTGTYGTSTAPQAP